MSSRLVVIVQTLITILAVLQTSAIGPTNVATQMTYFRKAEVHPQYRDVLHWFTGIKD